MKDGRPLVSFVVQRAAAPSFRLRFRALRPYLEDEAGLAVEEIVLPRRPEWVRAWRLHHRWSESDILVFSKLKLLAGELGFVARRCRRWVLDVDDAVMFARPRRHGDPPDTSWWRRRRFRRMVDRCSLVVAGSNSLAEMIEGRPGRLEVWPTPVDMSHNPEAPEEERSPLRIAWIGLGENLRYLEDLAPVLREVSNDGPPFELRVISDRLPDLPGVPCRLVPWSETGEGRDLAECDLGVAPMADDRWTRGKGGYRCIQYAAAGLATVTSPVGANTEIVQPGDTGLWASSPGEWKAALTLLLTDSTQRRRMGRRARELAAQRYALESLGPVYAGWLAALVSGDVR